MRVFDVLGTAGMRGTFQVDGTAWSQGLSVDVGGHGVVSHVGSGLLRLAADQVGLTGALSAALARPRFWPVHDRGQGPDRSGGDDRRWRYHAQCDRHAAPSGGAVRLGGLGHHGVASVGGAHPSPVAHDRDDAGAGEGARVETDRGPARADPARAAGRDLGEVTVIRLDASVVLAHSDKQQAGP